jgi:hypothetical protein
MNIYYCILFSLLLSPPSFAQQIYFDSSDLDIDYDIILTDSDTRRELTFKNIGNAPLVLNNFKGSCGCLHYGIIDHVVMPDSTGKVFIQYDTKRNGYFVKYFTLSTNSKNNSLVRIKIKGHVVSPTMKPLVKRLERTARKGPLWRY